MTNRKSRRIISVSYTHLPRISEITGQLKKLRKEIRMSVEIENHSKEMEERMRQAEQQKQQEKNQKLRRNPDGRNRK